MVEGQKLQIESIKRLVKDKVLNVRDRVQGEGLWQGQQSYLFPSIGSRVMIEKERR
jgi:hypothetical protein